MTTAIAASFIARQAFRMMELRPLQSFGENTEEAIGATEQYPEAMGMVLEAYDWSFARRLFKPALADLGPTEVADPDFPFTYTMPPELLKLRKVYDHVRYRLDGALLRCDRAGVLVRGTIRITNENRCPSDFKLAVSCQLAVLLSPKFVGSRTKRVELKDDLSTAFQRAITSDNSTASASRIDGLSAQTSDDWVAEVLR
ncbi:hypothetical protein P775_08420 [Puniceibacterium antarcticum]|uniref:Uncharacterized protein n=1 Tax=Puniceibacterium antarcticum TaxID=1206336 RepID=A0A2G8RG37_9RHOB|nr:hypothetical protein [Puniceibacterium antarcticum]PIL20544.1 hypothetical protein P775_08420 [Puniceibacterium antarcticum]